MFELTGMGSALRGFPVLYWILAFAAVVLAFRYGKNWQRKTLWAAIAIVVFGFLPAKELIEQTKRNTYAREAWAYFKKLCDEKSGEKIYKTFTGVKSVLVIKPLPPATEKDLYDQFWYGDPYSNATPHDRRDISKADTLLRDIDLFGSNSIGLEFVEIQRNRDGGNVFDKVSPNPTDMSRNLISSTSEKLSRFTIGWEDISKPEDRKYWVAASRLRIQDNSSGTVVAERIGYFIEAGFGSTAGQRRPWLTSRGPNTTCPTLRNGTFEDRLFILKVLNPLKE